MSVTIIYMGRIFSTLPDPLIAATKLTAAMQVANQQSYPEGRK